MILPKKILIVEDELITQRYIKNSMENIGIEVIGCSDSADNTLLILKDKECDMILMDINIRGKKDGILLAKEILQNINLPILFISAYNDDETIDEILEFSSDGFISKPFTSRELEIAVQISYKGFMDRVKHISKVVDIADEVKITEEYKFSFKDRVLYSNNIIVKLTHNQLMLMELLLKNRYHAVSIEEIMHTVWHSDNISHSTIRTLVYSLRKIAPTITIINHSKIGYSIDT
jgi:DNA-binding response OmpR family regulator